MSPFKNSIHEEQKWLQKPNKQSTHSENTDEIVADSDENKGEWSFLEIPVTEIFDEDKSEKNFEDNESFTHSANMCQDWRRGDSYRIGYSEIWIIYHNIPEETPYHHHGMGHDEAHKNLKEDHDSDLWSFWHLVFRGHREVPHPDLPDGCEWWVPEPSEDEEYECPSCEDARMCEGREHKWEEVHRWEVRK